MATYTDKLKQAVTSFVSEFERVGDDYTRLYVYRKLDAEFYKKYKEEFLAENKTPESVAKVIADEQARYNTEDIDRIDPDTMFNIINGVMWPSIGQNDTSLVDHPDTIELTTMRGVALKEIFKGRKVKVEQVGTYFVKWLAEAYADEETDLSELNKTLKTMLAEMGRANISGTFSDAEMKQLLSDLFNSEKTAKMWWVTKYLGSEAAGTPLNLMATLDPYLGYLVGLVTWLGGTSALSKRGITAAIQTAGLNKFPALESTSWQKWLFGETSNSDDVKAVGASVAALNANYKWLQQQKNGANKDYYAKWFDRFFKNKFSLVNMLIVINERVNINLNQEFKFSPKTTSRLKNMGAAYQAKFKITIDEGQS